MENNTNNGSFSSNGVSLQLRSKEVSEVMGNIPHWVGTWGGFLIVFFFVGSMLLVFNIRLQERIPCKAELFETVGPSTPNLFIKVTIPATAAAEIIATGLITLSFVGENNFTYTFNKVTFLREIKANKGSCIVQLPLNPSLIEKIRGRVTPSNTTGYISCRLLANVSIFGKVFNCF